MERHIRDRDESGKVETEILLLLRKKSHFTLPKGLSRHLQIFAWKINELKFFLGDIRTNFW